MLPRIVILSITLAIRLAGKLGFLLWHYYVMAHTKAEVEYLRRLGTAIRQSRRKKDGRKSGCPSK